MILLASAELGGIYKEYKSYDGIGFVHSSCCDWPLRQTIQPPLLDTALEKRSHCNWNVLSKNRPQLIISCVAQKKIGALDLLLDQIKSENWLICGKQTHDVLIARSFFKNPLSNSMTRLNYCG